MGVIARTSTMTYKHSSKDIAQIGRELGVDYVLESSVRREGSQVRITAQLIRVQDRTHLWAETYDRDVTSVLQVQDEIGRAIASQIQIKLDPAGSPLRAATQDPDAHDLYLRGRYYWNQLTPIAIGRGIQYFEQAVARDPGYALAYAGLAESYAMLPITCDAPALEILPKALDAARRAVELDDRLAEAHTAVGCIKLWMEWDWGGAESALLRAIHLNSNYVTAHRWYGHLLSNLGRHRESAIEMKKARRSDPLSPHIHGLSGHLLYQARQYDRALEHLRLALALNPELWVLHTWRGRICERKGMFDEASREFQKAFDLSGGNTEQLSMKGYIQARLGQRGEAEQAIRLLTGLAGQRYVPPYNLAMVYAGLSDVEKALEWLEEAYRTRDVRLTFLAVEPKWDFVRQHPQFQDLLRRLGLPAKVAPWEGDTAESEFSAGSW
jgi:tetratricopeptide (TPR) repeat protein